MRREKVVDEDWRRWVRSGEKEEVGQKWERGGGGRKEWRREGGGGGEGTGAEEEVVEEGVG